MFDLISLFDLVVFIQNNIHLYYHGRPARWEFPPWQPATQVHFVFNIDYLLVVNKFLSLSLSDEKC